MLVLRDYRCGDAESGRRRRRRSPIWLAGSSTATGRTSCGITRHPEHPTAEGKLSGCVVLDAWSRRVVGWAIDSRQRAGLATIALGTAIGSCAGSTGQINGGVFYADHGSQFTSWTFTEGPAAPGSPSDPYDNAVAEAFWACLQTGLLNRQRWRTRVELANAIFEYIEGVHNRRRRHSSLGFTSPVHYENAHPDSPTSPHPRVRKNWGQTTSGAPRRVT